MEGGGGVLLLDHPDSRMGGHEVIVAKVVDKEPRLNHYWI